MRKNLDKKHFTKPERIFGEILKRNHIEFQTKVKIEGREILISLSISSQNAPIILSRFLKKLAKTEIEKHTQHICQLLDLKYKRISIKDTVTRWRSCSAKIFEGGLCAHSFLP